MRLWSICEDLDFLSVEAKLYLKGKQGYKTMFGLLMSLLSVISILVLGIYFIVCFMQSKDINVLYQVNTQDYSATTELNGKPFLFRLLDISGQLVDPRIAIVTPLYFTTIQILNQITQVLETETCSYDKHLGGDKYKVMLSSVNITMWTCFKQNIPLNLTNDSKQNLQIYTNLYVFPCKNSSNNNNSCYSPEIIKNKLSISNFYFEYYFPSFSIDHSNNSYPIVETALLKQYKQFPSMYYSIYDNIKIVEYFSDQGSVFENIKSWSFFGKDTFSNK